MPSVAEGVKLGIQECQHQFRGRRWNCTTIKDNLAIFGPVLDKGKGFPFDTCVSERSVIKVDVCVLCVRLAVRNGSPWMSKGKRIRAEMGG